MWNWKPIYQDDDFNFYCDIDKVVEGEDDEADTYHFSEWYEPILPRIAVWTAFFVKNKELIGRYIVQRKGMNLPVAHYKGYLYTLCLTQLDLEKRLYRVIPATDYDAKDMELGMSALLSDETDPLLTGIATEWSPIRARKTHKAIRALFRFFEPSAK
jgi:hypothetical protein